MFTHIRDSALWAQALSSIERGRLEEAYSRLDKIKGRRRESSEYLAITGSTLVGLHNEVLAREFLLKAIKESEPTKPEYRQYIDNYSQYYICSIDRDEGGKVKYLQAALKVDAPPIIRRWLPLS
jgi:hypothetical protein